MADTAKAAATRGDLRIEHGTDGAPQRQVRVAHDPRRDTRVAVEARGAHGRDAVDELDLPDDPHLLGTVLPVHRGTLDEDRRDDVVPGVDIRQEIVEQVMMDRPFVPEFPEMMVGVADRQVGLERFLDRLVDPFLVRRINRGH